MEARAIAKYVRMSSSKLKPVADLVRGKDLNEAYTILKFQPGKASELIEKVVQSAAANAENNHEMNPDALYIAEINANQGPTMKRWRAGAQGRASMIQKKTSHIDVVLKEREELLEQIAALEAAKAKAKASEKKAGKKDKKEDKKEDKKDAAELKEAKADDSKKESKETKPKKETAKKPAAKKTTDAKKTTTKKASTAKKTPAKKAESKEKEVR